MMAPHNLWLRCAARGELGQYLRCAVLYGHHFEVDGKADPARTRLWLDASDDGRRRLGLDEGEEGLVAGFTCPDRGVYTLLAEYDLGTYSQLKDGSYLKGRAVRDDLARTVHFVHHAKTVVTVGDDGNWPGSYGIRLEIVPLRFDHGEIELLVQADGRPLADCEVFAHCNGRRTSRFGRTDGEGKVNFGLSAGQWMFIARRESEIEGDVSVRIDGATFTLHTGGPDA